MKLRPLQDRILVQRVEEESTTKGGIIIPDTAKETRRRQSYSRRQWQGW
jgi:co-chaperonin GroES (HSP10)